MNLLQTYLEGKTDFSSYDDFFKNLKINTPRDFNFVRDVVDVYAQKEPQKTALVWCNDEGREEVFDFATLSAQSMYLARGLSRAGIKKGDVVMLALHRRFEYWFLVLALHRIGAVALPVPSQLHNSDFEYRIKVSGTKMLIASSFDDSILQIEKAAQRLGNAAPILLSVNFKRQNWLDYSQILADGKAQSSGSVCFETVSPEEPMIMYFTSGTTDKAKLTVHNGYYPLAHIITAKYWQCVLDGGLHFSAVETGWAKASWGTIYGQWIAGTAVFVYDRQNFSPDSLLEKIRKYKVTTFCAAPTVYRYLVNMDLQKYNLSSLKHCCSAGEALNPQVYRLFYEKTGLRIFQGYGQTETALLTAHFCFEADDSCRNIDNAALSMGRFSPLYDMKLLDGEITINLNGKAPLGLMLSDFSSGVYHTGDLAETDKDGYVWFKGRKDNIIKSSGFRISPIEIETVLQKHPAVLECVVYGQDDEARGQVVTALVVPANGIQVSRELEQELMAFMRQETALYKCPRKIEFVKKLPKTYNGKILRYADKNEK